MPSDSREGEPLRKSDVPITQREALEAAGIDANAPIQVLRRLLCRASRGRSVVILIMVLALCAMAITTRGTSSSKYLYSPARTFDEESHLESHHWTQFTHGAPMVIVARDLDDLTRRTELFATEEGSTRYVRKLGEDGRGTTLLFRRLINCLEDPEGVINASADGSTFAEDADGFVVDTAGTPPPNAAPAAEPSIPNLRAAVDPVVFDPDAKDLMHKQHKEGRYVTRDLQWDRLFFVVTNVSTMDDPAVQCLTHLRASAAFMVASHRDWFSTHKGVHPPLPTHHISIALPVRRKVLAAGVGKGGTVASQSLTRVQVLLAPADEAAAGTFSWWAAQRVKHAPANDGVLVITPDRRSGSMSDQNSLSDVILGRWYHEHHSEESSSKIFKAPVESEAPHVGADGKVVTGAPGEAAPPPSAAPIVNPVHPALTVELGTDLQIIGPVTTLHDGTHPSRVPLLLTVRPDGLGVYRIVAAPERATDDASEDAPAPPAATKAPAKTKKKATKKKDAANKAKP